MKYTKEIDFVLDYAKNKVDDIEILITTGEVKTVSVNKGELEKIDFKSVLGLGVRVILKGKTGYAYTENLAEKNLGKVVEKAIENAWCIETYENDFISNFPDEPFDFQGYNPEFDNITTDDLLHYALLMEKTAIADKRVNVVNYCSVGMSVGGNIIANSKGMRKGFKSNLVHGFIGVLVGNEGEVKQGFYGKRLNTPSEPLVKSIANLAVQKAVALLNPQALTSGNYPVLIDNRTMGVMLETFSSVFSAKSVHEGNSLLKDKLNETIASKEVTIIDDGKLAGGIATSPFDAEGHTSQTTILIQDGVLINLLHNSLTAKKENTHSTGNASRDYSSTLTVAPTNIMIKSGKNTKADLLCRYPEVVEIVSLAGLHSGANQTSGDFSLSAEGFLWKDGNRQHALKNFTVSGNFYRMLKDIDGVGDDFEFFLSSAVSPSVLINNLSLSN
ncbi:MAG: TldD/PmbA family protein [Candidatus Cloacimonetes bacterium]|nr:TldD/PmbA family protein [Candidatus Cloacimonadota bacterium]